MFPDPCRSGCPFAGAWHALVVFDEPDPLRFSAEDVEDYLSTALRWANRVHDHDAEAVYPFIFWNAAWRAGASLRHGHAQVLVAKEEPYARVGALRDAALRFQADTGRDYFRVLVALHEALGLAYRDGVFYTTQRSELTRLRDIDGDGRADTYETVYSWPLEGNYHEYSYGPLIREDGTMIVTLNLAWVGYGASLSKWRGWMLEITPDGEMTPMATGRRSPAGCGFNV
ncbi:MAG: hypothetical protein IIC28_02635, partial [Chloroflexi bacterium]|nr:hypothetical protein [Chloroflexota bacterium]